MLKMFEPQLVLALEPDGEYTLNAVTLTPNSGYSAGRARRGVPPEVRILPEVEPVLLYVRPHRGRHLPVVTPVRHRLRNLKLGEAHGKTSVLAFVMLDDHVLGSASVAVRDPGCVVVEHPSPVSTSNWYAWVNRMPPGPPRMHVQGTVALPSPGYDVALRKAAPQGINPRDLILDLVLTERPGVWPEVVTSVSARYDEDPYQNNYDTVLVRLPGGEAVQLTLEDVY